MIWTIIYVSSTALLAGVLLWLLREYGKLTKQHIALLQRSQTEHRALEKAVESNVSLHMSVWALQAAMERAKAAMCMWSSTIVDLDERNRRNIDEVADALDDLNKRIGEEYQLLDMALQATKILDAEEVEAEEPTPV